MAISNVIMSTGAGAGAGASVAGGWGALIGAGVGLVSGLWAEYEAAENQKAKERILEKASKQLNVSSATLKSMADEYYAQNQSVGTEQDVGKYRDLVSSYDPNEFVYDYEDFDNNYDVNDYYAPNREAIIQKTSDALQSTAAGAGIGRGTGAANQIATGVANKNEELYRDALQAMNQDRQFAYNLWQGQIQAGQNRLNQLKGATDTQIGLYGNLAQDYTNYQQQKAQTYMDLERDKAAQNLQLALASI